MPAEGEEIFKRPFVKDSVLVGIIVLPSAVHKVKEIELLFLFRLLFKIVKPNSFVFVIVSHFVFPFVLLRMIILC